MTWDRIITSSPVNKTAALQAAPGEHWEPAVSIMNHYAEPPTMKPVTQCMLTDNFTDFTGRKFGRLTVLGLMQKASKNTKASWVCRCTCGDYCTKTARNLKASTNGGDNFMCGRCNYLQKLRREAMPGMRNYKGDRE